MNLSHADEILDAAEHIPEGATLIVQQVSWDDYERLLPCVYIKEQSATAADRENLRIFNEKCIRIKEVFQKLAD